MAENGFLGYLKNNLLGNSNAGTWNVLPAVLTTWSNLLSTKSSASSYDLYKQQAQSYIDTAKENAELIKNQGAIALRNLEYKNKLERGNDVVRIAAGNGHLSGSNLDVLIRKEKIRKMNEQTVNANYTNQAMIEMSNGYRNAAHTYGSLALKATQDKYAAIASILKGVETYVGLSVRDAKIQSAEQNKAAQSEYASNAERDYINKDYGVTSSVEKDTTIKLSGDGRDYSSNESIILNRSITDQAYSNDDISFC